MTIFGFSQISIREDFPHLGVWTKVTSRKNKNKFLPNSNESLLSSTEKTNRDAANELGEYEEIAAVGKEYGAGTSGISRWRKVALFPGVPMTHKSKSRRALGSILMVLILLAPELCPAVSEQPLAAKNSSASSPPPACQNNSVVTPPPIKRPLHLTGLHTNEPDESRNLHRLLLGFLIAFFTLLVLIFLTLYICFWRATVALTPHVPSSLELAIVHGLEQSVVQTFATFSFPPSEDLEIPDGITACQICQGDFISGERLMILPCRHVYHVCCIETWLFRETTCPTCRHDYRDL